MNRFTPSSLLRKQTAYGVILGMFLTVGSPSWPAQSPSPIPPSTVSGEPSAGRPPIPEASTPSAPHITQRASIEEISAELEAYIQEAMKVWQVPGAAVVIVKDGQVRFMKGFGVKKTGENDPVDPKTIFSLASVTKNFTAILMARLVDEGLISWDEHVITYLPEFTLFDKGVSDRMTIRDLFSHRSGLPGYSGDTLWHLGWSQKQVMEGLAKIPLTKVFREDYTYQNLMIGIAGVVIERVLKRPLAEIYQEKLFTPLQLTRTSLGFPYQETSSLWKKGMAWFKKGEKNIVTPHDTWQGKARAVVPNPYPYIFPATSGVNSCAEDLAKWLIFHLNGYKAENGQPVVSATNANQMRKPHVKIVRREGGGQLFPQDRIHQLSYGMGWFIHSYGSKKGEGIKEMYTHIGGVNGTRSHLAVVPEDNLGIAIVSNLGGMRVSYFPESVRCKILDLLLKIADGKDWAPFMQQNFHDLVAETQKKVEESRLLNPSPARDLSTYVGEYKNDLYGTVRIELHGKNLHLKYPQLPDVVLTHWNGDAFSFNGPDLSGAFGGSDQGIVYFGVQEKEKEAFALDINLLYEGRDPTWKRVG